MIQFPPERILVPFDFSRTAQAALETARRFHTRFGSELDIFYVKPRDSGRPAADQAVLRKLARAAGTKARLHVAEGDAAPAILRHARYCGVDLILMGTKGRSGLRRLREGSVTEAVVRDAEIPVLSIHGEAPEILSVLAPMNLEPYAEAGLVAAAQAAVGLGASLTVMHVDGSGDDRQAARSRRALEQLVKDLPEPLGLRAAPRVRVESGDPVAAVLEAAPAYGLVVLVARRKSVIGDAVLGTTAERVLRLSPTPVLTVPCPDQAAEPKERSQAWELPFVPPF